MKTETYFTKQDVHWKCSSWNVEYGYIAKKCSKLVWVHSCRGNYEFQISASSYNLIEKQRREERWLKEIIMYLHWNQKRKQQKAHKVIYHLDTVQMQLSVCPQNNKNKSIFNGCYVVVYWPHVAGQTAHQYLGSVHEPRPW